MLCRNVARRSSLEIRGIFNNVGRTVVDVQLEITASGKPRVLPAHVDRIVAARLEMNSVEFHTRGELQPVVAVGVGTRPGPTVLLEVTSRVDENRTAGDRFINGSKWAI